MIVKVCGMRNGANIQDVEQACRPDMMGFIFYPPSSRYVGDMPSYLPSCHRVGVFVDDDYDNIIDKVDRYQLSYVQLHGHETPDYCRELRNHNVRVIKAIHVADIADISKAKDYADVADYLLFETKSTGYGGSGRKFDWKLLSAYDGNTPFLLTGGIGADDATSILEFGHPMFAGVDLNSGFETSPGIKNPIMLNEFIKKIRYEQNK